MSKHERLWALKHPSAACKTRCISNDCDTIYKKIKLDKRLDRFENGGTRDAYRHIFYMAAFAQKINEKKIRKLGQAHEKNNFDQFLRSRTELGNRADSLSCVMDLRNNDLGIQIGSRNKQMSYPELGALVLEVVLSGKATILKRDAKGNFLNCEDQIIDENVYTGKWYVPKCLVDSDFKKEK